MKYRISTFGCIPVIILKNCIDVYLVHLTNSVNHSLQASVFPQKKNKQKSFHCIKNFVKGL